MVKKFKIKQVKVDEKTTAIYIFSVKTLEEVIIPDFNEIIYSCAFSDSKRLKNVEIPTNSKYALERASIDIIKISSNFNQICEGFFVIMIN